MEIEIIAELDTTKGTVGDPDALILENAADIAGDGYTIVEDLTEHVLYLCRVE